IRCHHVLRAGAGAWLVGGVHLDRGVARARPRRRARRRRGVRELGRARRMDRPRRCFQRVGFPDRQPLRPRHAGFRAARRRLRFPRGDTGSSLLAAPWCGGLLRRRDPLPWTSTGLAAREAKHRVTPRVLSRAPARALAAPPPRRPACWWPAPPGGVGPGGRLVPDPPARATPGLVPTLRRAG